MRKPGIDATQEIYFDYLDELRESGIVNMFGASSYLASEFPELTEAESRKVLSAWMKSFNTEAV